MRATITFLDQLHQHSPLLLTSLKYSSFNYFKGNLHNSLKFRKGTSVYYIKESPVILAVYIQFALFLPNQYSKIMVPPDGSGRSLGEVSDDRQYEKVSGHVGNKRQRLPKNVNPLQAGIQNYVDRHLSPDLLSSYNLSSESLASSLPKRYTIYQPLLLLPANFFSSPPGWSALYTSLNDDQRQALYASIATSFSRMGVTHIAINAPIAPTDHSGYENRMRSPTGLVPLYGDFGPRSESGHEEQPSTSDLEAAFWVRAVQNSGIVQTWAPLYTMFSRGNITEKARILGQGARFDGMDEHSLKGDKVQDISVVDMYAGIGYFVFSYLKRGVKRVWGWEINGWSVEGLRRGCIENGWGCKVVRVNDDGTLEGGLQELVNGLQDTDRVIVFHGDNRFAANTLEAIKRMTEDKGTWNSVRHVNLGLLPTSKPAWESACRMLDRRKGGWIHVHENVDIQQIDQKKEEIIHEFRRQKAAVDEESDSSPEAIVQCHYIEQVKTYAPGIMHCVFDIAISY